MRRLDLRPRARRDLVDIAAYIARGHASDAYGEQFSVEIVEFCERRCRNPAIIGSLQPNLGSEVRSWNHKGLVRAVRYHPDRIVILAIFSDQRDRRSIRVDPDG